MHGQRNRRPACGSAALRWRARCSPPVVVLGAWVRLTDAGLGCPDWPGATATSTRRPITAFSKACTR
jgi:hypothetical protein